MAQRREGVPLAQIMITFQEDQAPAKCSGAFISDSLFLTAGHCVSSELSQALKIIPLLFQTYPNGPNLDN